VEIEYLSSPATTNMADQWYEIAALDHFWILRRFDVLRILLRDIDVRRFTVGEVGCGHGIVQHQFHAAYGVEVAGFDLNVSGLQASCAPHLPRYYYNVRPDHLVRRHRAHRR
jgi:2-polyprenyl-3-methyl-5-hydroxy-6-metoxy-1,4-benzoquinol methylase